MPGRLPAGLRKRAGTLCSFQGTSARRRTARLSIERAMTEFGRLDILVNNAAHQASIDSIEEITSEEWDRTMRTNLAAMFYLCKAAVPVMRPGSAIINTSSIQSKSPTPELLAYATTKGAISNFTAGLAAMLAEKGIRVNAVAPGPIWTPLIPSTLPVEKVENFGSDTPLGRVGQPAELAARLRAAGLRRGQLHLGRRHPGDGWKADAVRLRGGDSAGTASAGTRRIFAPAEPCQASSRCRRYFHEGGAEMSVPAGTPANDEIARVAHAIWEAEGQPEGRDHEHWMRARQLIEEGRAEVEYPQAAPHDGLRGTAPGAAWLRRRRSRHGAGDEG